MAENSRQGLSRLTEEGGAPSHGPQSACMVHRACSLLDLSHDGRLTRSTQICPKACTVWDLIQSKLC